MTKKFASVADLEEKNTKFEKLAEGVYAYTAEGDPNSSVIIGDDSVMVVDAQATPILAQTLIDHIRTVTDLPIKHVLLTHYHAVRVLGASAYGAENIYASQNTYDLIVERGQQDYESELDRFPRLFEGVESVPGLTWPNIVFEKSLTVWMGKRRVELLHLGRGHTKGDTIAWLPEEKILLSGDLVEYGATPYTGDAYLTHWSATLDALEALGPKMVVPGRGEALTTPEMIKEGFDGTRAFTTELLEEARAGLEAGKDLGETYKQVHAKLTPKFGHWVIYEHCLPFNVTRAYDEAQGIVDPRIWTAERDKDMWHSLQDVL